MPEPAFDMTMTWSGAWLGQTLPCQQRPAAHDGEIHFRVELEAVGLLLITERLRLKILTLGQEGSPAWQLEAFSVPLINMVREAAIANAMPVFGWLDTVVPDFHAPLRMRADAMTEVAREHLGPETNSQKWRAFLKRNPDPVDLAAYPGVSVIDAHGTAEHDHPGVTVQGVRKRIAVTRAAAVKLTSLLAQEPPEPPGRRMFLVQDDQDPAPQRGASWQYPQ